MRCRCVFVVTCFLTSWSAGLSWADTTTFQSLLYSGAIIRQGVVGTPSTATGIAEFVLEEPEHGSGQGPTMSYRIRLFGVDLDGQQTANILDDVTAVHLHDASGCATPTCQPGDTVDTHHLLNIYGSPRSDDADLVVDALNSTLTGLWDDSDANPTYPPTSPISDHHALQALHGGMAFLVVHTNEVPSGAIGGFLTVVPEPVVGPLFVLAVVAGIERSRRRR